MRGTGAAIAGVVAVLAALTAAVFGRSDAAVAQATTPTVVAASRAPGTPPGGLLDWIRDVDGGLAPLPELAATDRAAAQKVALGLYLSHQEYIEIYYGVAGRLTRGSELGPAVKEAETRFHALLAQLQPSSPAPSPAELRRSIRALASQYERVAALAERAGVPLVPVGPSPTAAGGAPTQVVAATDARARTQEVQRILSGFSAAESAYRAGDRAAALGAVERVYLERVEPIESRLSPARVARIERLIHLDLRPRISAGAPAAEVERAFSALRGELLAADAALAAGTPFWFGAANAFAIIVREGLEAVLLIAALLASLGAVGAGRRARRRILAGVGAGVAATAATWAVARLLVPIGGASRELVEGVTSLASVAVLLYVSHWLFQKTYIHDWTAYLRGHLGRAVATGSALAMASLAFAAVYREGFETVLFYQALLLDAGPASVLAGFLPGLVLILGIGVAIIRLGVRLPLRKVFRVTNAILLYLAFVFLGKGIYGLQEAGLFTPHPLSWMPDHEALRQLLGVFPVAETLVAQVSLAVALLLVGMVYRRRFARNGAGASEPARAPAGAVAGR